MADYWKSQPRKFCQYCKCWIADNKPSIDFHERGKNHKENVAAKISEIKKKSIQKAKQEEKASKQFLAMEEAAQKAYEEDLKRLQREDAFGPDVSTAASVTSTYQPVPTVRAAKQPQPSSETSKQEPKQQHQQQKKKKQSNKSSHPRPPADYDHPRPPADYDHPRPPANYDHPRPPADPDHPRTPAEPPEQPSIPAPQATLPKPRPPKSKRCTEPNLWVKGTTDEGHIYYYNKLSGESRWDKPQPEPPGTSTVPIEPRPVCVWSEAVSPEGHTYYYNTVTAETTWEKPGDYTSPGAEAGDPSTNTGTSPEEEAETGDQGQESTEPQISSTKRKAEAEPQEEDETSESEKDSESQEPETPMGRFRPPNAYGTWERIKVTKDPYAAVDWQLPRVQVEEVPQVDIPPEPKHKFKTRVITSLGDSGSSSVPATFKKKKNLNTKARSLRQRDHDD
ncbi:unnamed protein product [Knipowitschia caucasica]